ncbi:MAG: ABC transporter ATP-binding protein [Clostridia bacterium]|nr:ABC transporter ATP-binding protein [Clostridia bacterium]
MGAVTIKGLSKSYGDLNVLNKINLSIEQGTFVTLLGPSGCGKSTLLRCLAGLIEVDEGQIMFGEEDVTHLTPQKRNIGMVFQNYALFPNLNVWENIAFGLKVQKLPADEVKERTREMIQLVALEGKEKALPSQLSGGQKQRVALARALVLKPKMLLLDEPLSALDAKIRKNLRLQIREIQRALNITTVFVTHDQEEALILSDEIFVMDKGEITQFGSAKTIYTQPANDFVAGFIGHYNILNIEHFGGFSKFSHKEGRFALRPEVIKISHAPSELDARVTAPMQVKDIILLGSILRYIVKDVHTELVVDCLYEEEIPAFKIGEQVFVHFEPEKLKRIG